MLGYGIVTGRLQKNSDHSQWSALLENLFETGFGKTRIKECYLC